MRLSLSLRPPARPRFASLSSLTFFTLLTLLTLLTVAPAAHAHLMVAQRGTLNFVGEGAFLVLSLPASAFAFADTDHDHKLSQAELATHQQALRAALTREVTLSDAQGPRPLALMMLSLAPPDDTPTAPASQLIVLGRFALQNTSPLQLRLGLFGLDPSEQSTHVTVTRRATAQSQLVVLSPNNRTAEIFPSAMSIVRAFAKLGAEHIVTGLDHMLFLLLVLSAGWRWRRVLLALSVFTVGHALTLLASVVAGLRVAPALVEPTIAATIVLMGAFDWVSRTRKDPPSWGVRLALVFVCSLVHGLGLATALTSLGLKRDNLAPSLLGFNLGIELAQLCVALLVAAVATLARPYVRKERTPSLQKISTFVVITVGLGWLAQRVVFGP
ncbi:MAG: HupE/UreJ family protein [Deltaproteobacteria bacterium]|nr:HupE/UreJ family protein [Deltaproteobacteria bacterium]